MSWKTVELNEVCDFQNGFAFKSNLFTAQGLPILRISNIQNQKIDTSSLVYFNKESYKERIEQYEVKPNDLLIAMSGATTGKIGFNNTDKIFYLNQRVGNFKPRNSLDKKYLYYFLSTQVEKNLSISAGAAQPNLSTEQIKGMLIPLPLIATQQKIVAKLDAIFAEIDKATAAAEANAKNAEALFQSFLKKVFEGNSLWIENTLGKCFELYQPKTITTKDLIEDGKFQVYGANGVIGRYDKYNHEHPQLLVTCRGATCGAVNVSSPFSWINGNAMVVNSKTKDIDVRFVEYFFRGAVDLTKAITGAAQPQITRQSLSPIIFKYPSLKTQQEIVALLDSLSAEIVKSKNSYRIKAVELTTLKQSILKQAFNGEFVKE